jgi:hypothetical protein
MTWAWSLGVGMIWPTPTGWDMDMIMLLYTTAEFPPASLCLLRVDEEVDRSRSGPE